MSDAITSTAFAMSRRLDIVDRTFVCMAKRGYNDEDFVFARTIPALTGEADDLRGPVVASRAPVCLIAGGPVRRRDLVAALGHAPILVAADGGVDRALALGAVPDAVVGDMDSASDAARRRLGPDRFHRIAEQESTDFDKALRHIRAPLVLAVGCLGGRVDHELAVLGALVRRARPCLLIGAQDLVFHAGGGAALDLAHGDRLSLFPMRAVSGRSEGLEWPIEGIAFAPDGKIGTSNRVTGPVRLDFDGPGMLVIVPRARLGIVVAALSGSGPEA